MKKTYMQPTVEVTEVATQQLVCASVAGVEGTGNMDTEISTDPVEEYLSRSPLDMLGLENPLGLGF